MDERYHATTQNQFYPDMSNVNKNIAVEGKLISPPTYIPQNLSFVQVVYFCKDSEIRNCSSEPTYSSNERDKKCEHNFGLEIPWKVVILKAK